MYRKLKRTWSHNDLNYIPKFKELFPELSKVDNEELADRFNVSVSTFRTWKNGPFPYTHIQKKIILLSNERNNSRFQ